MCQSYFQYLPSQDFFSATLALFSNFWISVFANDNYAMSSSVIGNLALANILFNSYIFAPGLSIAKDPHNTINYYVGNDC